MGQIAETVRRGRLAAQLSQRELAKRARMGLAGDVYISQIERGVKNPSPSMVRRLGRALELTDQDVTAMVQEAVLKSIPPYARKLVRSVNIRDGDSMSNKRRTRPRARAK